MVTKDFFCYKVNQRASSGTIKFVTFVAFAKDIDQWTGIRRVGEVERGTQRVLKNTRVKAIKRFISANTMNTIPVSVILAFNPGTITFQSFDSLLSGCISGVDIHNGIGGRGEWGTISFQYDDAAPQEERPALIVDGQHRVKGISQVTEDVPLLVTAFIDASEEEQAFQFVVINNKAQKVPTDNVKAIIRGFDEENLRRRLHAAGVTYGKISSTLGDIDELPESPFQGLLAWPHNTDNPNAIVPLTAIETCLRYIKSMFLTLSEDEDTSTDLFISIWKAIKAYYPTLWLTNTKFMSKVNIIALNEFVTDRLESSWSADIIDIYTSSDIESSTRTHIEHIPPEFWTEEWVHPIQDNAVVRTRIKEDLRKISQNVRAGRAWNEDLKLISQN